MSLEQQQPAAPAATENAGGGAAAPAAPAAGAEGGEETAGGGDDPDRGGKPAKPLTPFQRAERAQKKAKERLQPGAKGGDGKDSDAPGDGQAGAKKGTESTQVQPDETDDAGKKAAGGEDLSKKGASGSTVTAPADWPADRREAFTKLTPDAQKLAMDFYKEFQAGFTQATTSIAQQRKGNEALFTTLQTHGMDGTQAKEILDLAAAYKGNRKGLIQHLANEAKLEVFFERPLPEGQLPEFKNPAELAAYIQKQTLSEVDKRNAVTAKRNANEQQVRDADADLKRQYADVLKAHPDLKDHRDAVVDKLAGSLGKVNVQDTYDLLVTLPALRQQATDGAKAKLDLAGALKELETLKKKLTAPAVGSGRTGEQKPHGKKKSAAEVAMDRAKKKLAQKA